ncbi:unnamed protein product [Effrenium voratum]|uniref:Protein kinase domain-containing protein n=1 Tax=Effrenium voratum TaxID=2562239 RepID=A0AA36JEP7_9DINO|nr:unnamed protein product [Effrenium voratum]CAJ1422428.1 unnamed protein product [Effrenium voratum]
MAEGRGTRHRKRQRHRSRSQGRPSSGSHRSQSVQGAGSKRERRRRQGRASGRRTRSGERSPRHRDGGPPHIEVEPGTALGEEGRYVVEEVFGDGASGRVLGCCDKMTGEMVAVKVARPARRQRRHAETEVAMLQKMQRHDRELAQRHVVRLLDVFEHELSFFCIVMEPLAMNLRALLQEGEGGLYMADIRLMALQLVQCLAFFSSMGLAHGDLKCTNVMLRKPDFELRPHPRLSDPDAMAARPRWPFEVVVIDFGLANVTEPETSPEAFLFTREGPKSRLRVGARHIRAPEVILGLDWGCAADLWSLGCLLATVYTGERLFPAPRDNETATPDTAADVVFSPQVHDEMEHLGAVELLASLPPCLVSVEGRSQLDLRHVTQQRIPTYMASQVAERILEKGVAFDPAGRLLWPDCADNDQQVQHVEDMPTVTEFVLERHHHFLAFLQGLMDIDPRRRLTATMALQHPFLHKELVTELDSEE